MHAIFEINDLIVDCEKRIVTKDGMPLELPDLSFDLFAALLASAPEPLSTEEMSARVWNTSYVSGETIAQRIALLRKAIGDAPKAPRYIRTVRGLGYGIVGSVIRQNATPDYLKSGKMAWPSAPVIAISAGALAAISGLALIGSAQWANSFPIGASIQADSNGNDRILLVERAKSQLSLHQPKETERAIEMLRTALTQDPNRFDARLTLSFALTTYATKFRGDYEEKQEAEQLARALIDEQPLNSNAWSALGYVLGSQARSDEALAAYRRAYEIDPENASAISSAAYLLLLKGDFQQALILEEKARILGAGSRYAEIQIAQILELLDDPSSLWWRQQALTLNPGQVVVTLEIASSHLRDGRPNEALEAIQQYDGEAKSSPQLLALKGRVLLALGKRREAQQTLGDAGWRGHYLLAAMAASHGDPSVAKRFFPQDKRDAIAGGTEALALIQLAEVDAALDNFSTSAKLISQAVSLGWRDRNWLKQSPYIRDVMATDAGRRIDERIVRELAAQRGLINSTRELDTLLNLPNGQA